MLSLRLTVLAKWDHIRGMRGRKIVSFGLLLTLLSLPALAKLQVVEPDSKTILSVLPGASVVKHKSAPLDHYLLLDSYGNNLGVAVITTRVPPEVTGYQNEIALLVGIDKNGKISDVKLLAHEDNPEHINLIVSKGFLDKFKKRNPAQKWNDIETVTGATISSTAMLKDIQATALETVNKVIKNGLLSSKERESVLSTFDFNKPFIAAVAVVFLAALSIFAVYFSKKRTLRISTLILSFLFIGVLFNVPITIGNFIDMGFGIFPGLTNLALFLLLIYAAATALLKGPLYCSYLCPFGALQEGAAALKIPKLNLNESTIRRARLLRWLLLIATVVAVVGFNIKAFRNIEPFAMLFSPVVSKAVLIQAVFIVILGFFFRRPWCRVFCPTGLVIEILSRLGTKLRCKIMPRCKAKPEVL